MINHLTMKKIYFTAIASALVLAGQPSMFAKIPKHLVLVEKWSGTWCHPCTGAARALHEFDQENLRTAQVSYQIEKNEEKKSLFEIEEGTQRGDYYGGVKSYPTTRYNGNLDYLGGNSAGTIYPAVRPLYDQAIAVETSFDIEVPALAVTGEKLNATAKVRKVDSYDGSNLRLRAIVVEKNIKYNWNGMTELHYVARQMPGGADGAAVSFTADECEVALSSLLKSEWASDELSLIVFLQDDDTKEVLQTVSYPISRKDIQPQGSYTTGFDDISVYWYPASPFAGKLNGYNVYGPEGDLMGTVPADENTFTFNPGTPGAHNVRVAADYQDGEGELSEEMSGKAYRHDLAMEPRSLAYDGASFTWEAPLQADNGVINGSSHQPLETSGDTYTNITAKGGGTMFEVWAVWRLTPEQAHDFRGLDIARVSFIPGDPDAGYAAGVFRNGKLMVSESIDKGLLTKGKMHTHTFASPVFIGGDDTIDVGYRISALSSKPLYIDNGPVIAEGLTNLLGVPDGDGVYTWKSLYTGNNIIEIGLNIPGEQGFYEPSYTLSGYNLYRNGEKANESLIPSLSCLWNSDNGNGGTFTVKAVYDKGESIASNEVVTGTDAISEIETDAPHINVAGRDITANGMLAVYDLQVHLIASGQGSLRINTPGLYIVACTPANGQTVRAKVTIK